MSSCNRSVQNQPLFPAQSHRKLRVGIAPWSNLVPECFPHKHNCNPGVELEILEVLSSLLNFEVEFKIWPSAGCGTKNDSGAWTGLLGMLQNGEIDMTGNVCSLKEYRSHETWLAYSSPILLFPQSFLIKAPEPSVKFRPMRPFRNELWLLITLISLSFAAIQTVITIITTKTKFRSTFVKTVFTMLDIFSGMDGPACTVTWFLWICISGALLLIYSSFVKISLISPSKIDRPFANYKELAVNLYNGRYRLVDYSNPPSDINCYEPEYCKMLQSGVKTFDYFDPTHLYTSDNPLLSHVAGNPNVVFVSGGIWMRMMLQNFKDRSKLWLIADEEVAPKSYAYFFRREFELAPFINRVIVLLGSFSDNVVKRYTGLSYLGTINTKVITLDLPDRSKIGFSIVSGPLQYLFGLLGICSLVLVAEVLYHRLDKVKKQRMYQ